ncbi:hypothetical protein MPER_01896 [Moniliophthora perniciosa FA553]|nr:hypothetical protein MPER_01896 [Moniliophthora perniciosa FA553]
MRPAGWVLKLERINLGISGAGTHVASLSYPFFFGAIQMVEYKPEITNKVVNAMHKFVKVANTMLRNGFGVDDWAETRWEDFVIVLQW